MIQFEFKKIFHSNFFRFMLLFLFILVYFTYVYIHTVRLDELISEEEHKLSGQLEVLKELEKRVDSGELEKDNREYIEEKELLEKDVEESKKKIKAYKEEDWATLLNIEIDYGQPWVDRSPGQAKDQIYGWPTHFTTETRLVQHKWMREKDVTPIFHIDMFAWYTAYDIEFGDIGSGLEESIKKRGDIISSSGTYYINHVFTMIFTMIGASFFLFLFADIVTKEGLGEHGSINFLRIQPIHWSKILLSKFITLLISTILILAGVAGISLLLGTVFDRFGDWNYPMLIYGEEFSYQFINLSTFLLRSVSLFLMVLLFYYSLLFLFSILSKRTSIAIGLTLVSLFIGMKVSEETIPDESAHLNPFNYFSTPDVITQEIAFDFDKNFDITFSNGMIVLGVASGFILVLMYFISFFQYKYLR